MLKPLLTFLICCLATASFVAAQQQSCSQIFMSEYVEGTHNNKAIEIYNPTNQPVDLANYRLVRWNNGANVYTAQAGQVLSGIVGAKEAFVFVLDKQDCSLTGSDTCVFQELKDRADAFICPNYDVSYSLYHNGNDVLSLHEVGATPPAGLVDIIGVIGEDSDEIPGSGGTSGGWTDVFPYTTSSGSWWTRDQTMVRKASVTNGRIVSGTPYTGSWNPSEEWDTLGTNIFGHLGWHECACGNSPNSIKNANTAARIMVFPNPAPNHTQFFVSAPSPIARVEVMNIAGQTIWQSDKQQNEVMVELNNIAAGTYIIKTTMIGNYAPSFDRVVVQ
jgi:hypothetical protein